MDGAARAPRPLNASASFDLVLSLRGLTIEREVCRAVPGSEAQAIEWRQLYEAYGFERRPAEPAG